MWDYICEGILVMILRLLSVKFILRCRSVCKEWKILIDSPFFMKEHLSVQKPRFSIHHGANFLSVDPQFDDALIDRLRLPPIEVKDLIFLGTQYGLIFLCDYPNNNIFIWNPSIRKFSGRTLPKITDSDKKICVGLWMDLSKNEFKFLNIVNRVVYSSIGHEWRVIPEKELRNWKAGDEKTPLLMMNGMAHWIGNIENDLVILSFDFVHESFDFIEMPEKIHLPSRLFHWQGTHLSFIDYVVPLVTLEMYSRRGSSWVKMFRSNIDLDNIHWVFPSGNGLRFLAEDIGQDNYQELILYDYYDDYTCPCYLSLMSINYNRDVFVSFDFVESLLSPP